MSRRQHAIVATLCFPVIGLLGAGCDEQESTPQVIFDGTLQRGVGNDCRDSGPLFQIGEFGTPALDQASKPIPDGERFGQGVVSIACSVIPAGTDEFDVDGSVNLSGATGGFFSVKGRFKATGDQTGIHAVFSSRRSGNSYEQKDGACTVRYTTSSQGVAAGRVWGEITCPNAENTGAQTSCEAVAQFRFENCAQ